jgi:hypothetical protein
VGLYERSARPTCEFPVLDQGASARQLAAVGQGSLSLEATQQLCASESLTMGAQCCEASTAKTTTSSESVDRSDLQSIESESGDGPLIQRKSYDLYLLGQYYLGLGIMCSCPSKCTSRRSSYPVKG